MPFYDRRQFEQLGAADPEIEARFQRLIGGRPEGRGEDREFVPAADMLLTPEALVILVEVAGLRREDVRLAMSEDELEISGRRREPREWTKERYFAMECAFGAFRRRFRLPGGLDVGAIEAGYSEGFLTIRVPRLPGAAVDWREDAR